MRRRDSRVARQVRGLLRAMLAEGHLYDITMIHQADPAQLARFGVDEAKWEEWHEKARSTRNASL